MAPTEDSSLCVSMTETSSVIRTLEVEVDAKRVRKAFDRAYRDLGRRVSVRGFRPGKAPRSVLEKLHGAAVAEEMGLAGSLAVLAGFGLLRAVGFGIALRSRDRFRKYLAGGLTIVLGLQAFIILAGVLRVLPITGLTLPFMSYGGSSLVANMVIIALLLRVSHEERL